MISMLIIPDTQAKPGDSLAHIEALNKYILDKRPDCIVQLGDLWDFPSLSSWDKGKKAAENRRVSEDWEIGVLLVALLMDGWEEADYFPELYYVEGNHEDRVRRYMESNPEIDMLPDPVGFMMDMGWNAYEFLHPVVVHGITFCHFFPKSSKGTVTATSSRHGATNAMAQLRNNMTTCIAGHRQGYDSAIYPLTEGRLRSEIVGSFYMHDEAYMGPHGNDYWRGVLWLNRVNGKGDYDKIEVSLDYLLERYGQ